MTFEAKYFTEILDQLIKYLEASIHQCRRQNCRICRADAELIKAIQKWKKV